MSLGAGIRGVLLTIFIIFGLFLVKGSITGFVVTNQSCCTPNSIGCTAENTCPFLQQPTTFDSTSDSRLSGLLILIMALGLLGLEVTSIIHKRKREEERRRKIKRRVV